MSRRHCVVVATLLLASCSSTDSNTPGPAGGAANAGAGTSGSAAGGSGGASNPAGSAGLAAIAGASGSLSAGSGGASGGSVGVSGAAGASAGAGGSSGASAGAGGASAGMGGAGGSAGKGGSGGNAGGAGAPVKYCDSHALSPAPVIVTDRFDEDQVGNDLNLQLTEYALPDVCDEPAEDNAVGSCAEYGYTPEPAGGTIKLQWVSDPVGIKYGPVCMAAGMTKVMFRAKGKVGGEVVGFGASQAATSYITLTNAWAQYSISLANVKYNTDLVGVQPGFFWTIDSSKNPGSIRFAVDDIKYVNN
jgi:hypothetical protein